MLTIGVAMKARTTNDARSSNAALRAGLVELPCFLLYVGWRRAQEVYKPLLGGQSPQRMYLLHLLQQHGELGVTELARALDLELGSVSGLLSRMESEGWIARRRNERNRLEVRVSITPQGRALQRRLAGAIERFDRKLLRSLSEADRLGLARVVARLEELSDAS